MNDKYMIDETLKLCKEIRKFGYKCRIKNTPNDEYINTMYIYIYTKKIGDNVLEYIDTEVVSLLTEKGFTSLGVYYKTSDNYSKHVFSKIYNLENGGDKNE